MAFNSIEKADALALLAKQDIDQIIQPKINKSVTLSAFPTTRMSAGTLRMPVLAVLPTAGWVKQSPTDPEGVKPTSKMAWENKELIAEELAVIIPVHEDTIEDSDFDIWSQVKPRVTEEFGRLLDLAVLFGVNKPDLWQDPALVPGAVAAENVETLAAGTSLYDSVNNTFALVEEDEFDVNKVFTGRFMRSKLRGLRDETGSPLYLDSIRDDGRTNALFGEDLHYVGNKAWQRDAAELLVGDRDSVVIGIREDVQVKLLDQATVGGVNLAERDMIGLRFKFRVGYALAHPTAGLEDNAFPWAVLAPAAPGVGG